MTSQIEETIARQRQALEDREETAYRRMLAAYEIAIDNIEGDLLAVTQMIEDAQVAGEPINPDWLRRQDRYLRLLDQADAQFARFSETGNAIMIDAMLASADAGSDDAIARMDDMGIVVDPLSPLAANINTQATELLVAAYDEQSPLRPILDGYGERGASIIESELVKAITSGRGARATTAAIRNQLTDDYSTARLAALVRTESMRAYRGSQVEQYRKAGDSLVGWIWTATLSPRTCLACLAMHLTEYPLDEPPSRFHINCRCSISPKPARMYAAVKAQLQSGPDWLAQQDEATQRRMLGSSEAFEAYKAGDLRLDDFVGVHESEEWGDSIYQLSGKRALEQRDASIAVNRPRHLAKAPTDRHFITRIGRRTAVKQDTTLIEPGIDVQADLREINAGRARRSGNRYTVNGRTYEQEPNGTLFPVEGVGFTTPMPRPVMNALKAFARYNGINEQSNYEVSMMDMPDEYREEARRIWRRREQAKQ